MHLPYFTNDGFPDRYDDEMHAVIDADRGNGAIERFRRRKLKLRSGGDDVSDVLDDAGKKMNAGSSTIAYTDNTPSKPPASMSQKVPKKASPPMAPKQQDKPKAPVASNNNGAPSKPYQPQQYQSQQQQNGYVSQQQQPSKQQQQQPTAMERLAKPKGAPSDTASQYQSVSSPFGTQKLSMHGGLQGMQVLPSLHNGQPAPTTHDNYYHTQSTTAQTPTQQQRTSVPLPYRETLPSQHQQQQQQLASQPRHQPSFGGPTSSIPPISQSRRASRPDSRQDNDRPLSSTMRPIPPIESSNFSSSKLTKAAYTQMRRKSQELSNSMLTLQQPNKSAHTSTRTK
jgi:hypothetical protein